MSRSNPSSKGASNVRADFRKSLKKAMNKGSATRVRHIIDSLERRIEEVQGWGFTALAQSFEEDKAEAEAALVLLTMRKAA